MKILPKCPYQFQLSHWLVPYFPGLSKMIDWIQIESVFLNQERTRACSLEEGGLCMCPTGRADYRRLDRTTALHRATGNVGPASLPSVSDWLLWNLVARNNYFQMASCNPLHLACESFPCFSLNMCIAFYKICIPIVTLASSKWPPTDAMDWQTHGPLEKV